MRERFLIREIADVLNHISNKNIFVFYTKVLLDIIT